VVIERSAERMRYLDDTCLVGGYKTLMSNPLHIANAVQKADLLIEPYSFPEQEHLSL